MSEIAVLNTADEFVNSVAQAPINGTATTSWVTVTFPSTAVSFSIISPEDNSNSSELYMRLSSSDDGTTEIITLLSGDGETFLPANQDSIQVKSNESGVSYEILYNINA